MKKKPNPTPKLGRPATGITPKRYFRMSDEDWQAVVDAARSAETTTSEWVRDTLLRAVKRQKKK